jgi:hypothetical protein
MSVEIEFFAETVRCYTENEVLIIGLGDQGETPANFVIVTRFDETEDVEGNDDAIGVQTNLSEREYSGVVNKITLTKNIFEILIKKYKIDEIEISRIKIGFDYSKIDSGKLIEYLHGIFDRSSVVLDISY